MLKDGGFCGLFALKGAEARSAGVGFPDSATDIDPSGERLTFNLGHCNIAIDTRCSQTVSSIRSRDEHFLKASPVLATGDFYPVGA